MTFSFPSGRRLLLLWVALAVAVMASDSSMARRPTVSGYLKSYSNLYAFPDYTLGPFTVNPPPEGAVSNRLRLKLRWPCLDWASIDIAYDISTRIQEFSLLSPDLATGAVGRVYRVTDLDSRLYPQQGDRISSFGLFQNLDRAELEFKVSKVDIYVGRQAIAWGTARVVNPTDILTTFSYTSLDTEDRFGVDAIRARWAISFMSELDVGLVAGSDFEPKNSAAFVRYKTYVAKTDLTWIIAGFREHLMAGFDLARSIGEAGGWLEVAQVWPKLLASNNNPRPDSYLRLSAGADYNLGPNTYGFIEYHYNQAGTSDPAEYRRLVSTPAYTDGAVYLLGEHYLTPGITHQITPLVTGTAEVLANLSDQSAYIALSIEYSIAENIYLQGGGYIGLGPGPTGFGSFSSEFGSYPEIAYGSFRYYF